MKNTNIYLLGFLALAFAALAVFVVIGTRNLDKMMEGEVNPVVVEEPVKEVEAKEEVVVNKETVDALQESFDSLLSWESIEELYEWQTGYGFIGSVE